MDSTTPSQTPTNPKIIVEGGPSQRSKTERLRVKRKFTDLGKFWPDEKKVDIVREIELKDAAKRANSIPQNVTELEAEVETITIDTSDRNRVNVQFTQNSDPNFDRVKVWVKGYGTDNALGDTDEDPRENNLPWMLYAEAQRSPVALIFEESAEEIMIGIQSINEDGLGPTLDEMPTIAVTLL